MRGKQMRQGLLVGVFLLAAFWLVSLIVGLIGKVELAVTEAHNVQVDYKALEERKNTLQANIAALNTEHGKDAAIRTAFGVARPGEEIIVVVPPASEAPTTTPSWWHWLFNWF